jgi:hypothetical protein
MASFVLSTVTSKLPSLVEKFEPELENGLRTVLKKLKTEHPEEATLFLTNWSKIDKAVKQELVGATAPSLSPIQSAARRKRTRRTRRHRQ